MSIQHKIQNRREFFRTCARNTILTAMAFVGGKLLFRETNHANENHKCINNGICNGCRNFSTCGLPQALSAKQVLEDKKRDAETINSRQQNG